MVWEDDSDETTGARVCKLLDLHTFLFNYLYFLDSFELYNFVEIRKIKCHSDKGDNLTLGQSVWKIHDR